MDNELVTLHFDDVESAEATMATIRSLQAEGFIELDDAAIVTRSAEVGVTVTPVELHGTPKKAAFGAVIGLVAGSLVGLPVLGAMAGSSITGNEGGQERSQPTRRHARCRGRASRSRIGRAGVGGSLVARPRDRGRPALDPSRRHDPGRDPG